MSLMKYIWDLDHHSFSHICPYFWLSVFNVLIIIPFFIVKTIIKVFYWLSNYFDSLEQISIQKRLNQLKQNPDYLNHIARLCDKDYHKFLQYIRYEYDTDDYYTLYTLRDKYELEKEELERKREKDNYENIKIHKEKINRILKYIKPISVLFLYILGFGTVILTSMGIYYSALYISSISTQVWLHAFYAFLVVVAGIILILGLFKIISYFSNNSCSVKNNRTFKIISSPFIYIGGGIKLIFLFFIEIIKNNCPAIDWK